MIKEETQEMNLEGKGISDFEALIGQLSECKNLWWVSLYKHS